jgi:hypothetical protein
VPIDRGSGRIAHVRRERLNVANRRIADVADRERGRLNWADSALAGVASGMTGVRAIADIQLRARSTLHRPKPMLTCSVSALDRGCSLIEIQSTESADSFPVWLALFCQWDATLNSHVDPLGDHLPVADGDRF